MARKSLEPVAQAIRQSEALEPIIIQDTLHCISLYADDILIFTKNPSKTLCYGLSLMGVAYVFVCVCLSCNLIDVSS